ncbi:hypothetical protein [Streptomyces sp. NPDC058457]|uniref:hypothetical protein n=1 Tax=Streptomyces sp. NPDC058457 TaxID=3346507 RepID=UPI00364B88D0
MARAFVCGTRATVFAATAGLALTVAFLPGAADAALGGLTDPFGTGTPMPRTPPASSQETLVLRDARLSRAEQRPGVRNLREQLGVQGVPELDPNMASARQVDALDGYLTPCSDADPADVGRRHVRARPDVIGLTAGEVEDLTPGKQCTDVASACHLSSVQSSTVPVFGDGVKENVSCDGWLIRVLGAPARSLPSGLAAARGSGRQAKRAAVGAVRAARARALPATPKATTAGLATDPSRVPTARSGACAPCSAAGSPGRW